uniref:Uncharacterized protein n=1 Tax=Glossina pallidipes TaxID=7398 RepID=A0A1A9ZP94_GLOPL
MDIASDGYKSFSNVIVWLCGEVDDSSAVRHRSGDHRIGDNQAVINPTAIRRLPNNGLPECVIHPAYNQTQDSQIFATTFEAKCVIVEVAELPELADDELWDVLDVADEADDTDEASE